MSSYRLVKMINPVSITVNGTFTPKGAYDNSTDYAVGDQVDYSGTSYIMYSDAAAGTLPTDNTKWGVLAAKGDTGDTGAAGAQGIQGIPGNDGADGLMTSVVAGNNIDVDNTDPANPIVSVETLTSADVGLGNVDNTSDANKPVSTATQTALDAKATTSALTSHTSNTSNPHSVTKSQVGLGNVDNTSDTDKPVSTATQTALDAKVTGAATSLDNAIVRFDGTTGKAVQDSPLTVIDDQGRLIVGATTTIGMANPNSNGGISNPALQNHGDNSGNSVSSNSYWGNNSAGAGYVFGKSRGSSIGAHAIVSANDGLGKFVFSGSDGTQFYHAAEIAVSVDGTPATGIIPGKLSFITTNASGTPTENVTIKADGSVGVGTTTPQRGLHVENTSGYIRLSDSNSTSPTGATTVLEMYDRNNTTLLSYIGFTSTSDLNMEVRNYQNGDLEFWTNNTIRQTIKATGETVFATVANTAGSAVSVDGTQTLTNKRITERVYSTTSSATPSVNTDNYDMMILTNLSANITGWTVAGTPTDGQRFWVAITDNGTPRTITWGSSFESSTYASLPGSTTASTRMDLLFVWNSVTSKLRLMSVA